MKRIRIPARPDHPDRKKRFMREVTVILGDDIEEKYNVAAKDFPDDLPDHWIDPDDKMAKKKSIDWISNFGLTQLDGTPVTELPKGEKYTVELPKDNGEFVFYDGRSVRRLPVRTEDDKVLADFTLGDPPVGSIK